MLLMLAASSFPPDSYLFPPGVRDSQQSGTTSLFCKFSVNFYLSILEAL